MPTTKDPSLNSSPLSEDSSLFEALSALGRSIEIIKMAPTNFAQIEEAIWLMYHTMLSVFAEHKIILLSAFHGKMTVNQTSVNTTNNMLKPLEDQLILLRITGLQIKRNVSKKELSELAHLLTLDKAETFSTGIRKAALSHITIPATRCKTVHIEQIVAFLKGDIMSTNSELNKELTHLATNPDRLGQLLIESALLLQQQDFNDSRSFKHLVIECLRRAFFGIRKIPHFSETSEGVEQFKKSLARLQNGLCKKIAEQTGSSQIEMDKDIERELLIMQKDLDLSLFIHAFSTQHDVLTQYRNKIKTFLHAQNPEIIEELLEHGSFQSEDWQHILHGDEFIPPSGSLETPQAIKMLAEFINEETESVNSHPTNLTENLTPPPQTRRFSLHKKEPQKEIGTIGGQGGLMNRKELLFSISEVAQELMQPLTAMNATLEMLSGGYVGDVTPEQQKMLLLAYNSGDHLRHLMEELIAIVGFPTNKGTDKRFHTTSDEVAKLQQNKDH